MKSLIFTFLILFSTPVFSKVDVMLESGGVWQHRNDAKIPTASGTLVEFDNYNQGPFLHYRAEAIWSVNESHNIRAVYAPFNVVVKGPIADSVDFNNKTFSSSEDLEVDYTFNSYRLTYFYSFWGQGPEKLNLGVTGKVRDAEILFKQSATQSSYTNTGFVPLIYFEYQTSAFAGWLFNLNVDAAAASQGRAIDLALKLRYPVTADGQLGIGVRSLEGGADNDKVYTFSWFNYIVVDYVARFGTN